MSDVSLYLWLSAFAGCLVNLACTAFEFVTSRRLPAVRVTSWVTASLLLYLIGADALAGLGTLQSGSGIQPSLGLLLLPLGMILISAFRSWADCCSIATARRAISLSAISQLLLLAGTASRFYSLATPQFDCNCVDLLVQPVPGVAVVTDRGRSLPVYHVKFFGPEVYSTDSEQLRFRGKLIPRALPDATANCHGWVFTGGRYLMFGDDVQKILEDHDYQVVTAPREGDVIVYRDDYGKIRHTGLVYRVPDGSDDGSIVVESKWATGGRFLHRAEDQCYSDSFAFYRASRDTHTVTISSSLPLPSPKALPLARAGGARTPKS